MTAPGTRRTDRQATGATGGGMANDGIATEAGVFGGRRRVAIRARDLHGALRSATNFGTWVGRRLSAFTEGRDYAYVPTRLRDAGRIDALLAPEVALRVALSERKGVPPQVLRSVEAVVAAGDAVPPEATDATTPAIAPRGTVALPGGEEGDGRDRDVDLHEALGVRTDVAHWRVRRVEAHGLKGNVWVLTPKRSL